MSFSAYKYIYIDTETAKTGLREYGLADQMCFMSTQILILQICSRLIPENMLMIWHDASLPTDAGILRQCNTAYVGMFKFNRCG